MKTVLVTGASSGIGRETATLFLKRGHRVYGAARRVERLEELSKLGGVPLEMDVTVEEDIVGAVRRITDETGGIDVLVNNAGFGLYGSVEETAIADARHQFDVNVFGLARITQLAIPHMREQRYGKIVNISSVGGKIYTPLGSWYHATKHAIEGWSDALRLELAPFGIDVIVIEPGLISTEFNSVVASRIPENIDGSPYGPLIRAMIAGEESRGPNSGSPPSVVAETIYKAVTVRRPKTRYATGRMAKMLIGMRSWFGDRFFDRAIMRAFT